MQQGWTVSGVKQITSTRDLEILTARGTALVDFGAPWCAPCRLQEPILLRIAAQFSGKAFVAAMNIDGALDVAADFSIRNVPTLILFVDGKEVRRFVGLQSEETLSEALERLCRV